MGWGETQKDHFNHAVCLEFLSERMEKGLESLEVTETNLMWVNKEKWIHNIYANHQLRPLMIESQ